MKDPFIVQINKVKNRIERQYQTEFNVLYKRIANDILNLTKTNQNIDYKEIFNNYKPDYIAIFRKIFSEVNRQLGWDVRKKLNFKRQGSIEIKSNIQVPIDTQDKINTQYNKEYTYLLNNYTENMVNDDFIKSESDAFEKLYTDSVNEIHTFLDKQKQERDKYIAALAGLSLLIPSQAKRYKLLDKQQQALEKQIQDMQDNLNAKIRETYKSKLQKKADVKAQQNSEYVVSKATKEIRGLENNVVENSNETANIVGASILLREAFVKIWRNLSQYYPKANPRPLHLALDGVKANEDGLWNVEGIMSVPHGDNLGPDQNANCRCEYENVPNW